ncbi:sensor histidine kinase [Leucobacter coleopterorum]|uniref:histidine kinase n=1 Tax=Leucobacter coleopterorum TaxID=2714933 RepID=A0ABX6JTV3_9MICO|nr:sensor histidine kinase [Leucobacter coleopterorum]QIM17710.1 sensor histidine kinase [Leucobacter coleopterorum]
MNSPVSSPASSRRWRALLSVIPTVTLLLLACALALVYIFSPEGDIVGMFGPVAKWLVPVTLVAQAGLLALRDRWPLVVFIGVILLDIPFLAVSHGELTIGALAILVAVYTLRRRLPAQRAYIWILGGLLFTWIAQYLSLSSSILISPEWRLFASAGQSIVTYGLALAIAEAVITQGRLAAALRERAELAERDRDRNAQEAIRQERNLIARELHDIAAHHLTGIILSTQAVSSLMATDPEKAREYLSTVQVEARTALDNVRQTVGLLRTDDEADLAPAPTYNDLSQLIEDHRARGTLIALDTTGDPVALGPIAGNAVYRTVQEALANAAKHAPGSNCSVRVVWASDSLNVVIENGPAIDPVPDIPSGGYGLLGMRERARLVHGTLDAEPRVDGGWRTELNVPYPDNMARPDPLGETSLPGSDR